MKFSNSIFILILLSCSSCSFFGNEYRKSANPQFNEVQSPLPNNSQTVTSGKIEAELNFQNVSKEVLQKRCVECHSSDLQSKNEVYLNNYEETFKHLKEIKEVVLDGSMPPKRRESMTESERNFILDWIAAGAPEQATTTDALTN